MANTITEKLQAINHVDFSGVIGALADLQTAINTTSEASQKLLDAQQELTSLQKEWRRSQGLDTTEIDLAEEQASYEQKRVDIETKRQEAIQENNEALIVAYNQQLALLKKIHDARVASLTAEAEKTRSQDAETYDKNDVADLLKYALNNILRQKEAGLLTASGRDSLVSQLNTLYDQFATSATKNPDKTYRLDLTAGTQKLTALTTIDPQRFLAELERAMKLT